MITADEHIHGPVQFNAALFHAAETAPLVNAMDDVAGDHAVRAAQTADHAGLPAVAHDVATDDMSPNPSLCPRNGVSARIPNGLLVIMIVDDIAAILAKRDARAGGVAHDVVLDDPAPAPVAADQADLLGGRRRRGRSRVAQDKPADGDEVDAVAAGIEHRPADIHLDFVLARILLRHSWRRP